MSTIPQPHALQEEIKRCINSATIMQKNHEKFGRKGAYMPAVEARCIIP